VINILVNVGTDAKKGYGDIAVKTSVVMNVNHLAHEQLDIVRSVNLAMAELTARQNA
jgi:hypothetical protein